MGSCHHSSRALKAAGAREAGKYENLLGQVVWIILDYPIQRDGLNQHVGSLR